MPEASWGGDAVWDFNNEWTSGTEIMNMNIIIKEDNKK